MMRRMLIALLALTVVGGSVSACQRTVSVKTGELVECRYGHVVKNTVHTIKVPAEKAGLYSVKSSLIICPKHQQLLSMYESAQKSLAASDTAGAQAVLKKIVAQDPTFAQASKQLAVIASGKTPVPDSSAGSQTKSGTSSGTKTSKKPSTPPPSGPVLTLASWCPQSLQGFTTRSTAADALTISREYVPKVASQLEALVIYVEQFSSKSAAAKALKTQMSSYPKAAESEQVAGRSGQFGTDGKEFGAYGFTTGAILVILEGHAKGGADPKALDSAITQVAAILPAR